MHLPRITESPLPMAAVERDDFADDPAPSMSNRETYSRPSQRDMVRASLDCFLHTHAYDRESL